MSQHRSKVMAAAAGSHGPDASTRHRLAKQTRSAKPPLLRCRGRDIAGRSGPAKGARSNRAPRSRRTRPGQPPARQPWGTPVTRGRSLSVRGRLLAPVGSSALRPSRQQAPLSPGRWRVPPPDHLQRRSAPLGLLEPPGAPPRGRPTAERERAVSGLDEDDARRRQGRAGEGPPAGIEGAASAARIPDGLSGRQPAAERGKTQPQTQREGG